MGEHEVGYRPRRRGRWARGVTTGERVAEVEIDMSGYDPDEVRQHVAELRALKPPPSPTLAPTACTWRRSRAVAVCGAAPAAGSVMCAKHARWKQRGNELSALRASNANVPAPVLAMLNDSRMLPKRPPGRGT